MRCSRPLRGAWVCLPLRQARGALIRNSRPLGEVETFLHVEGDEKTEVALLGNDLRKAKRSVDKADGAAVKIDESGNLIARQA